MRVLKRQRRAPAHRRTRTMTCELRVTEIGPDDPAIKCNEQDYNIQELDLMGIGGSLAPLSAAVPSHTLTANVA